MLDQISFHYKTKRINFGRPTSTFEDTNTRIFLNVDPDPDLREKYEAINPYSVGVQASVTYSSHSVNTEVTQTKSEDVVHKEGGWPQGIDPTNAPSCKQTRSKLEKKENFIPTLRQLAQEAEKTVKLNLSLDLFSDHFQAGESAQVVADPSMRTLSIFRDKYENRMVSSISWEATSGAARRVALCYTPKDISCPTAHYESFIYNLECPSVPETELHPPSALLCLEYNTKDSNFLVGGMNHGSLCLWDIRQGSLPVWTSAIESSHRGGVYAVRWISSKTAFECVSVSSDGTSMTWDTRSNTSPLETIQLAPAPENLPEGFAPPFGGRCLDYHTGVPTKYMVGTVEGLVMSVNRKASDPSTRISGVFPGHYGPVYAVRRHPTDTKYFASVSDWCCRFFTEDNKTPLLTIPAQRNYLTNAVWGLSRTTVVYTGSTVGTIDAWDLIQSLREPVTSISVGNNPIYSMAIENTGQFLLTGDSEGTATLLELNEPLRNITQTEKSLFNGMMGREAKRVKNYDQFIKEQKMREKQKANSHMEEGEKKEEKPFDPEEIEREFEAALRGEKETVVEKKRVVIGEEEGPPPETKPVVVEPEGEEEEEAKNEEEDGEKGNLESHISGIAHGMLGGESNKGEEEESKERAAPGEGESDSPKLEGKGLDIVADAVADGAEDAADEAEADKAAEEDKKESEKGGEEEKKESEAGGEEDKKESEKGGEEEKKESETGGEEDKKESETGGDEDKKEEGGALEATLANATGGLLETGGEEEKKEVEADSPKLEGAGLGLVAGAVADDADKAADEAEAEKAAEAEEEKKESDTAAEEDKKESEAGGEEEKKESEAESPQLEGGGLGLIAGAVADGADKAADDAEAEQEKKESEKEPEPEAQERAVDQEPAAEADSPKLEGAGLGLVAGALADGADKAADEAEADKAAEEEKKEGEKEGEEDKKESETGGEEDKKESEKGGEEEKKESEKGGEEDKKEEGGALEATLANAAGGLLG